MAIRLVAVWGTVFLTSLISFGQSVPTSQFDAASVKPASAAGGATFQFTPGGGLTVRNATLKDLVETGYDVRDFQISGGPGWINSDRYDITAKSTASPGTKSGIDETRRKVQALLAERFGLTVHRETKELPVYELAVSKSGMKLKSSEGAHGGIDAGCGQ